MIRVLPFQMIILLFSPVLFSLSAVSQVKPGKYEFGIGMGMMIYQGDLTPSAFGSYRTGRFGLNIYGGKQIGSSFLLRGNFLIGKLAGDDSKYSVPAFRQERNFKFNASVKELTGQLVWLPFYESRLSPYLFGGAGLSSLRITRDWSGVNYSYFDAEAPGLRASLAVDSAQRVPGVTPVILTGFGLKYVISNSLSLNAEYSYRFMRTDYLDGFSVSANPDMKDHYMNYSIGVSYRTGRRSNPLDCPTIKF